MELSRQEYWRGLLFPSPGDLPNPGIEPRSPALQVESLSFKPPGKLCNIPPISLFSSYSYLYEGILLSLSLDPLQALHLRYCLLWLTFKKPSYTYKLSISCTAFSCSLSRSLPIPVAAAAAAAKLLQSCPTLCDPIDSSPPGSPIPESLQARTLEWVAISFSNA